MEDFEIIDDQASLNASFESSKQKPVVIFKHSTACPISAAAHNQMQELDYPVSLLIVQRHRDLSNEIAERTGITHETPQVIILKDEKPIWTASHWNVTAKAVENAVAAQGAGAGRS